MRVTVEGVGDVDVDPGTSLAEILDTVRAPAAVWCGGTRLDAGHAAGRSPLVHAALLTTSPGPPSQRPLGPHLEVVAGPDAGGLVAVGRDTLVVGRVGTDVGLAIDDPAMSARHLAVDGAGRARDLGSTNGTALVRRGRRRHVGRWPRALHDGDVLQAGDSVLRWHATGGAGAEPAGKTESPGEPARSAPPSRPGLAWLGGIGGAAGGLALAASTGRWQLAAAALAMPAVMGVAALVAGRRNRAAREAAPNDGLVDLAGLPLPIAIRGEAETARAAARAVALARGALPDELEEPWMRWLDRALAPGAIVPLDRSSAAPSDAATVLDVDRATVEIHGRAGPWRPALVSVTAADAAARRLASSREPDLPASVRWADLRAAAPTRAPGAGPRRLVAAVGTSGTGTVTLDLDRDGPHLLVAGTTGSGKSILLETLVAALAHAHGPQDLGLGLIDLKGGAGLAALRDLPHARGLLTDLATTHARRALLGIAHELRSRKGALAERGLTSWAQWEAQGRAADRAPARLVVVVDEFQELGAIDPGFVPELARLAAQGRSLGMHLILATQRPAGAVTPEIRANVSTMIALRTATAGESQDLIGEGSAADLPVGAPGRAIVATAAGRETMQAALPLAQPRGAVRIVGDPGPAGVSLAAAAVARWEGARAVEPLWLPSLAGDAEPRAGTLGWVDLPETRTRTPLRWDTTAGPCVVVGPRASGRSSILGAIASITPQCIALPEDPREAARTLDLAARHGVGVVIDDVERAVAGLEPILRGAEQALEDVARRVPVALACGPGWGARWAARAGLRIVLSGLDPIEQTLWGVPPSLTRLAREPGRGVAIGVDGTGECLVTRRDRGRDGHGPRLVAPLVCPPDLAPDAVGVVGDAARPLVVNDAPVAVVGPAGAAREEAIQVLSAAGISCHAVTRLESGDSTDRVEIVVEPGPAHLATLGLRAFPGLVDAAPPRGRVVVRRGGTLEAAQLRTPA